MVNILQYTMHTIYSRNNIGKKCEGNCGLWILNEIIEKIYPENLKKIVGAVWEFEPISTQIGLDWLCYVLFSK